MLLLYLGPKTFLNLSLMCLLVCLFSTDFLLFKFSFYLFFVFHAVHLNHSFPIPEYLLFALAATPPLRQFKGKSGGRESQHGNCSVT